MPLAPGSIYPVVSPAHDAPRTKAKDLLDLDMSMGRIAEEILPELRDSFLSRVHRTVRGWSGVFENAIVAHKPHHTRDIVAVKSLIELKDDADRRFYPRHSCWAHRVITPQ